MPPPDSVAGMTVETLSQIGDAVEATLNFVARDSPVNRRFTFPGDEVNTGHFEPHRAAIRNARRATPRPTLQSHGFELFAHRSAVRDFHDRAEIDAVYPAEVAAHIQRVTGADLVVPMSYVLRFAGDTSAGQAQPPAADVHVDLSPQDGPRLAARLFERPAAEGKRYRRFFASSLWRAYSPAPQDWPLAVCDGSSIGDAEGTPNYRVPVASRPSRAEMFAPRPNESEESAASIFHYAPHHRWFYYPDMNRDEVVLLTLHDSDHARPWRTPHTAFRDETRPDARPRQSIEFRSVAYWL